MITVKILHLQDYYTFTIYYCGSRYNAILKIANMSSSSDSSLLTLLGSSLHDGRNITYTTRIIVQVYRA